MNAVMAAPAPRQQRGGHRDASNSQRHGLNSTSLINHMAQHARSAVLRCRAQAKQIGHGMHGNQQRRT